MKIRSAFGDTFRGRTVLVTGHTGFKGAWLSAWLRLLGAEVVGFALPPETDPSLFTQAGLVAHVRSVRGDVLDLGALREVVEECRPAFVFHLAAQALVGRGFREPTHTFSVNVIGTANVLEALRLSGNDAVVIVVTSDKCYENREWEHGYRETDPMGGVDPYSASKGCAELVTAAYRRSFCGPPDVGLRIASARAGNVIGGGDWAEDRIVPDLVRAFSAGEQLVLRNPRATRPWQHVLDCLSGYLTLASALELRRSPSALGELETVSGAFNFGPDRQSNRTVDELVGAFHRRWPGRWEHRGSLDAPPEGRLLSLSTDKAYQRLAWRPVLDFEETVALTVNWYLAHARSQNKEEILRMTEAQIDHYCELAFDRGHAWAAST